MINPLVLKEAVKYQTGSIVSKEFVKKPTGTITLFAFDAGQGLNEHRAPYDALVMILDGKAEVTLAGKKYFLEEGEVLLMPADKPHALFAKQKFKMMLVMIKS